MPFYFYNGHSWIAQFRQGIPDNVKLLWPDYCFYLFHEKPPSNLDYIRLINYFFGVFPGFTNAYTHRPSLSEYIFSRVASLLNARSSKDICTSSSLFTSSIGIPASVTRPDSTA